MDPLKKSKVVTGCCAITTVCLLGTSIVAFAKAPADTQSTQSQGNEVSIELEPDVYDGLMGMLDYYSDYDSNEAAKDAEFVASDEKLYIILDGEKYPVVETEQGLVVSKDVENPEELIGTLDADGVEIVGVTEDGLPIIGYDNFGNAIIGNPVTDVPLSDAIGCDNPLIQIDENGNRYYHIVWGDTLCKISSELHYSVDELAEYNHIRNVNLIYAESDLRIPDWEAESDEDTSDEVTE